MTATKVDPTEYVPCVSVLSVPEGNTNVGPMPQMTPSVGCLGEKKKLGLMSSRPNSRSPVIVSGHVDAGSCPLVVGGAHPAIEREKRATKRDAARARPSRPDLRLKVEGDDAIVCRSPGGGTP